MKTVIHFFPPFYLHIPNIIPIFVKNYKMKITDLKVGDKLFCIKPYVVKDQNIQYVRFKRNKTYTVTKKIGIEIQIETEKDKRWTHNSITINAYGEHPDKDETFLNEHFITFYESRKIKLQELETNNFKNFLKNIKK